MTLRCQGQGHIQGQTLKKWPFWGYLFQYGFLLIVQNIIFSKFQICLHIPITRTPLSKILHHL